jgi:hypothetical protein
MNKFANSIIDCFGSFENGVIASRNVIDIIIKNYSPIAFAKGDILQNHANSFLFDDGGKEYFGDYYTWKLPVDQRKNYATENNFLNKIKELSEKLNINVEVKHERKIMEKYERAVERREIVKKRRGDIVVNLSDSDIDFLRDECKNSINDPQLTKYVKWQIGEILTDCGVEDSKISEAVDNIFSQYLSDKGILSFYDKNNSQYRIYDKNLDEAVDHMAISSHKLLIAATYRCYSSREVELVANQKIADVLLKNYSPVAFLKNDLNKYANNYIIDNEDKIGLYYDKYIDRNRQSNGGKLFIENVKAAHEKIENSKPNEEPKPIEQPKNEKEPLIERISILEAAEVVPNNNVSSKINENSAQVSQNVKK